MAAELLERRSVTPSRSHGPNAHAVPSTIVASARRSVMPSPVQLYSSLQQPLEITGVAFSCKQSAEERHTERFELPGCDVIIRRGNTLILNVSTSVKFSSTYTVTLTFVPVFRPRDRFGQFRAKGVSRNSKKLWLSIDIPANFPIGKFHTHVSLSLKGGADIITHFHHGAIVILFNPWNPDDDAYLKEPAALQEYVLSDVGVIWRGTCNDIQPTLWEFGQFEEHCLDVALYLLRSLSADECRSASSVCRGVVGRLHCRDQMGVMAPATIPGRFAGGMHPCRWNGSPAILQKFHRTRTPVRFASCWVFAGVAVSLLRGLGVPSRPATCYNAAHHCSRKPGQLDRYFSTEGDLLGDIGQDQLWVYHVWCEGWMRRDDLPPGYDGWQVLDATAQPKQSGHFRTGPASVRAIREKKSGKNWPYGNEFIISEVSADTRYLRVTKSYSSFSNSTFTVAQVRHDETGTRIVTTAHGSGATHPHDITALYKDLPVVPKADLSNTTSISRTHFPPPSRDCTFEVSTNEGVKLGEDVMITVAISNKGAMLRTLDGRVVGKVIRYTGQVIHSFASMQFTGVVSPGQTASVCLPIEATKYSRLLVDQALLQFFVVIKARESKQLFLKVQPFQVGLPLLEVECPATVAKGEMVRLRIKFRNVLRCSLSRVLFLVQAQHLLPQRELTHKRLVLPGRVLTVECQTRAQAAGSFTVLACLHCDQLTDVRGSAKIMVLPSPPSSSSSEKT